jgi:hypothetical protein
MSNCCKCFTFLFLKIILLINNSINLITTFIAIIVLNWEHAGSKGLLLFIIFVCLYFIIEILLLLILFWTKSQILLKYDSKVINFGFIGLILSIVGILIVSIAEILIKCSFDEKDYPCKNYKNVTFSFFRMLDSIENLQEKQHLCETLDMDYYTNTITKTEIIILYVNSSIIELISFINVCLWAYYLKIIKQIIRLLKLKNSTNFMRNLSNKNLQSFINENGININPELIKQSMTLKGNHPRNRNSFIHNKPNFILHYKKTQKHNVSKNDIDFKDSVVQRDRSESSLNIKRPPIVINTLNIFNKKVFV